MNKITSMKTRVKSTDPSTVSCNFNYKYQSTDHDYFANEQNYTICNGVGEVDIETLECIKKSREDISNGDVFDLSETKRKLGLK